MGLDCVNSCSLPSYLLCCLQTYVCRFDTSVVVPLCNMPVCT